MDEPTSLPSVRLNLHPLDLAYGMYYLLLIPGYVPPAPDGKVYLYVTVNDYDNSQMIPSAYITASWSGGGYAAATTSAYGTAILTVKNSTSVYLTATKSGYVSVNKVITTSPFGPDATTIGLHRGTVTAAPTSTTGPGGTIAPTPTMSDSQSQAAAGSIVIQWMPQLVMFFIMLIIIGGVKMIGK